MERKAIARERAGILRVGEALDRERAELESQRRELTREWEDLARNWRSFLNLSDWAEEDYLFQKRQLEEMMEAMKEIHRNRLDREVDNLTEENLRQQ